MCPKVGAGSGKMSPLYFTMMQFIVFFCFFFLLLLFFFFFFFSLIFFKIYSRLMCKDLKMYVYISIFFRHFSKGNNFRDFLFASLADIAF